MSHPLQVIADAYTAPSIVRRLANDLNIVVTDITAVEDGAYRITWTEH